jgi:hypothetical protein
LGSCSQFEEEEDVEEEVMEEEVGEVLDGTF